MNNLFPSLLLCVASAVMWGQDAGQELSRQNEITDATTRNWYTSHDRSGNGVYTPPTDMSEKKVDGGGGGGVSAIHPEAWPEGDAFLEAKSLPRDLTVPAYDRQETLQANGRRVLGMLLKPGEKVEFSLKSENDQVTMRTYIPNPPPAMKWKLELLNANRPLRVRRTKHLEIQNPTSEPQTLFLILYGVCDHAYRIDRKSIPAKG